MRGGRDLAGEEKPEHGFGEHLGACFPFGEDGLAFFYGSTVKADAFVCVEDGALPDHCLEASVAIVEPLRIDVAQGGIAYLIPPMAFSTLTSPMTLLPCSLLTFFNSSRLAGITSFRVAFRSGSDVEE